MINEAAWLSLCCKMDRDRGIPIQHIPWTVRQEVELHLDTGNQHTWEDLAACMDLDAATVSVRVCLSFNLLHCWPAVVLSAACKQSSYTCVNNGSCSVVSLYVAASPRHNYKLRHYVRHNR